MFKIALSVFIGFVGAIVVLGSINSEWLKPSEASAAATVTKTAAGGCTSSAAPQAITGVVSGPPGAVLAVWTCIAVDPTGKHYVMTGKAVLQPNGSVATSAVVIAPDGSKKQATW